MSFISYAQNFEDVMLWRALKHIKNGFYIDIGAQDPIVDSVSKSFYEQGWRGLSVDPVEQYVAKLRSDRKDEIILQAAIGNQSGFMTFYAFENTGLSTGDEVLAKRHVAAGFPCVQTSVPIITLDSLLDNVTAPDIHWMKIDVEGFEASVLSSWHGLSRLPWIVVVESTVPLSQEQTHHEWEHMLLAKGYQFVFFDGLNRFYVSPDHSELIDSFQSPPNIFDGFVLSGKASHPFYSLVEMRALQIEMKAAQAEAKAEQADAKAQQAKIEAQQVDAKCIFAEQQVQRLSLQLDAMYTSRSWRMTSPLRWIGNQYKHLLQFGLKARVKALMIKVVKKAVVYANSKPKLKFAVIKIAHHLGIIKNLRSLYNQIQLSPSLPQAQHPASSLNVSPELGPRARQIYLDLMKETNRLNQGRG